MAKRGRPKLYTVAGRKNTDYSLYEWGVKLAMAKFPSFDVDKKPVRTKFHTQLGDIFVERYKHNIYYGVRQAKKWIEQVDKPTTKLRELDRYVGKVRRRELQVDQPNYFKEKNSDLKKTIYAKIMPVGEWYYEEDFIYSEGVLQEGANTLMHRLNKARRDNNQEDIEYYGNMLKHRISWYQAKDAEKYQELLDALF